MTSLIPVAGTTAYSGPLDQSLIKHAASQELQLLEKGELALLEQADERALQESDITQALFDQYTEQSAAQFRALAMANDELQQQLIISQGRESEVHMAYAARLAALEAEITALRAENAEMYRKETENATKAKVEKENWLSEKQKSEAALVATTEERIKAIRQEAKIAQDHIEERVRIAKAAAEKNFNDRYFYHASYHSIKALLDELLCSIQANAKCFEKNGYTRGSIATLKGFAWDIERIFKCYYTDPEPTESIIPRV